MRSGLKVWIAVAAMLASPLAWSALTFTGNSGARSASASFDIVAGKLQVVLTNASTADALVPVDVLTGIFFSFSGNPALLAASSATALGSTYKNGVLVNGAGTNVGGEWAYSGALGGSAPAGVNAGISSSGLGIFGNGNFGGPDLAGPPGGAVDGLQYGITTAGDNVATGNTGILGDEVTKNSVKFLLTIPGGFSLSQISNVLFQYGTSLSEPRITSDKINGTPEPASLLLAAAALLATTLVVRRRA